MGSITERMSSNSDDEVLEPQGTYHPWYSVKPLVEAASWASTPGAYFQGLSNDYGGEPVYKCHPGFASIAITDHASGEWFFNQPDSVLDRQLGAFFGPLKCREEYLANSLPALVTNNPEEHAAVRAYTLSIMKERLGSIRTAWQHSADNFYNNLWNNGMGEYSKIYDIFLQQCMAFMLEWWFATGEDGGQELPSFKDFINVNPSTISVLLKLTIDTPVANSLAQVAQALSPVTDEQKASIVVLLESIRASRMYPRYVEMMEEQGVEIEDLENSFMFNTGFQSSSAMAKQMEYCVGSLTAFPDFLSDLRGELDGKDLTYDNINSAEDFPLLDSFHWEILRYCPAPPFFFKEAKEDLIVPTSSGKQYQIKKGDMLQAFHPLIHIDEAVFGSTARQFNPRRFIESPELKSKVLAYAFPNHSDTDLPTDMPWGCAAHTAGVLDSTVKLFYARWVQEAAWELKEPPVIDPVEHLGIIGPQNNEFTAITPRS